MKNFVQNGDYLEITAPATITSGQGVLIGDLFGVAVTDIASGANGILAVEGVYEITKATDAGSGGTIWAPAYFDATQNKVTAIASGNVQVGLFTETTLDAATSASVLLSPQTGEKDEVAVTYASYGAGSLATQVFFVAPVAMRVLKVSEVHSAAETTAATLTGDVLKDTSTDAPGAGTSVLGATKANLKSAANTVQNPALSATAANVLLAAGDRLAFKPSAAGTEAANVVVTVHLARA
jgi:predicted RecA/RadA family phage recombinase